MDRNDRDRELRDEQRELRELEARRLDDERTTEDGEANPPHTTTGKITSPKFGSAGSGGAELEPGLDKN
jgi:hypothetical protein